MNLKKQYVSIALIVAIMFSLASFELASAAKGDIRFDFDSGLEGVSFRGNATIDSLEPKDGMIVGTITKSKPLKNAQVQIMTPPVDFGDGGYYMHVNAKYEFSENVTIGSHFAAILVNPTDVYPKETLGTSWTGWSGFKTLTYNITGVTGEVSPAWYMHLASGSGSGTGTVWIESIVFSKSSTPPAAVIDKTEAPYIEMYKNSDSKAIRFLVSLGIMNYDEVTGLFWDNAPVTRSSMAEILCKLYGLNAIKSTIRMFEDVSEDKRAFVETAVSNGYMAGYNDRYFGPDDYVTKEQLIKIFVTLLGGQGAAETLGGFPEGYLLIGRQLGLKISYMVDLDKPVSRGDVADIIYEAMHSDYMNVTGIQGNDVIYNIVDNQTFLTECLGIYRIKGIMSQDSVTSLTSPGGTSEKRVVINGNLLNDPSRITDGYLGCNVIVYEKRVDESIPGDIIYIEESNNNRILRIDGNEVVFGSINGKKITYFDNDKSKNANLSNAVDLIYNGVAENFSADVLKGSTVDEIILIDNDDDGKYDVVSVYDYNDYILSGVFAEDKLLTFQYDEQPIKIEDDLVRVYQDDIPIQFGELSPDTVVSIAKSRNNFGDKLYTIKTGIGSFNGKVEATFGDKSDKGITINSKDYSIGEYVEKLVSKNKLPAIKSMDEAKFYMNFKGEIAAYILEKHTEDVACLLKYALNKDGLSTKLQVALLTQDGKIKIFTSEDAMKINGSKMQVDKIVNDSTILDRLATRQLVKYKSDGDNLKSLTLANDGYEPTEFSKDVPYSRLQYNRVSILAANVSGGYKAERYVLAPDTVVFSIPVTGGLSSSDVSFDESLYKVEYGRPFGIGASYLLELYDVQEDGTVHYVLNGYDPYTNRLTSEHSLAVVTGKGKELDENDDIVDVVYGYDGSGLETKVRFREDCVFQDGMTIDSLEIGDVINYITDSNSKVAQVKCLFNSNTPNQVEGIADTTRKIEDLLVIGNVALKSNSRFSVYTTDTEPQNPIEADAIVSNTGTAVFCYDSGRNCLSIIDFGQIEKGDKIFALINKSNTTRMLVVYR